MELKRDNSEGQNKHRLEVYVIENPSWHPHDLIRLRVRDSITALTAQEVDDLCVMLQYYKKVALEEGEKNDETSTKSER